MIRRMLKRLLVLCFMLLASACSLAQLLSPPAAPLPTPFPTVTTDPALLPTMTTLPTPTDGVTPHVGLNITAPSLRVGDTTTITARVIDIGLPRFTITLSSGATLTVDYQNQPRNPPDASPKDRNFEIVSAEGDMTSATFVLRALAPGTVEMVVNASGEIHEGYPGPAYWGGDSESFTLTVFE
jgi:hypothetical protein